VTWGIQGLAGIIVAVLFIAFLIMQNGISAVSLNIQSIQSNSLFLVALALIGFAFSYFFFYLCTRFIHRRQFISLITTKSRINWGKILKGAALWFSILGVLTIISFLINPGSYELTFNPSTFGMLLILSLITFPIQASFEEVFFRGYLMQGFGLLSKKPVIPLLVTSLLFGLGHIMNGTGMTLSIFPLIETIIIGIALGAITLGEGSIETAIGIHVMNNLYAVLIVSTPGGIFGNLSSIMTNSSSPYGDILVTTTAAVIAILVIFWNKKDKLVGIFKWKDAEDN
jgi:membrane protease YdiL (CAAX protease family)